MILYCRDRYPSTMNYMLLLACICVVSGVENKPECVVGPWGSWRESAPVNAAQISSHHVKATKDWDAGADTWEEMMAEKEYVFNLPVEKSASELNLQGSNKCIGGFAGGAPCWNVHQLAFMNFTELGCDPQKSIQPEIAPRGTDLWGWTDHVTGEEYVIMGVNHGSAFVGITDPYNPEALGFMYNETETRNWRDMKVIGDFVFIGAECYDHGMQIFDMTSLRGQRNFVPEIKPDAGYKDVGQSHNIVANEETGYIYIVGANRNNANPAYDGCHAGLHAVDVRDPKNPKFAGCYAKDGYTHDAQCVIYRGPDARFYKREICFAFNEDTVTIVDVTDKSNMFEISKVTYYGEIYTHQGWVTEDHTVLLMDDEGDQRKWTEGNTKTFIWDIQDLTNPVLKNVHYSDLLATDHNQYIREQFVYQANYQAGLRILEINQRDCTLREVGYFDVYPVSTLPEFAGSCSVFPYFKSRVVAISSIDYGLFLVRPDYRALEMVATTMSASSTQTVLTRYREILFKHQGSYCPATQENIVV